MNKKRTLKYSKENQSTRELKDRSALLGKLRKLYSENWNNINNQVKQNFLNFLYCQKYNTIDIIYVHLKLSRVFDIIIPISNYLITVRMKCLSIFVF